MAVFSSGEAGRVDSFIPGQKVWTSFGPGIVSAVSRIDSIVYVAMSEPRSGLYLLKPEQVKVGEELQITD